MNVNCLDGWKAGSYYSVIFEPLSVFFLLVVVFRFVGGCVVGVLVLVLVLVVEVACLVPRSWRDFVRRRTNRVRARERILLNS